MTKVRSDGEESRDIMANKGHKSDAVMRRHNQLVGTPTIRRRVARVKNATTDFHGAALLGVHVRNVHVERHYFER